MSKVYWKKINSHTSVKDVQNITRILLQEIIDKEKIELEKKIPLKVHFGEKGNHTFIRSENYEGIIGFLQQQDIETCYMETSAMYGGQRHNQELHIKTAKEHGFTQIPIIIADGEQGEDFVEVEINKKQFQTCKIGKAFLDYSQVLVISHFKGHALAGFGGAIKQLSMGHASKGGKMAMHLGIKPHIINRKCQKCGLCKRRCNENAITIGEKSFIDLEKCVGCGACVSICPAKAVSIISVKSALRFIGVGNNFKENLVEYAFAAQLGKRNIYLNFAMNITAGCDCEPKKMKLIMEDLGIFISTDPVAIDKACFDMVKQKGRKFRGASQFEYAEHIGLGTTKYELIEI
ncbi:MAG: DUF362 domain-containing protein [Candidatus Cloacimonetes bacterium]|nr:DUF362 domain-containing protein [Candidatus Cloacimonadota bacterium]